MIARPSFLQLSLSAVFSLGGVIATTSIEASPTLTSVSPAALQNGTLLTVNGNGFLPAADNYSVTVQDAQGIVAIGEVVAASSEGLEVRVGGIVRGSNSAEVVVREGLSTVLIDPAEVSTIAPRPTWFQGSGTEVRSGPVVVLPPLIPGATAPEGVSIEGYVVRSIVIFINPFHCQELTARIVASGDDPFEEDTDEEGDLKAPAVQQKVLLGAANGWRLSWQKSFSSASSLIAASSVAAAFNEQFRSFGVLAAVREQPQTGDVWLLFYGARMGEISAASLWVECPPEEVMREDVGRF